MNDKSAAFIAQIAGFICAIAHIVVTIWAFAERGAVAGIVWVLFGLVPISILYGILVHLFAGIMTNCNTRSRFQPRAQFLPETQTPEPNIKLVAMHAPAIVDSVLKLMNEEWGAGLENWVPQAQYEAKPATDQQVAFLRHHGFDSTGWMIGYADRVIELINQQMKAGYAKPDQIRFLLRYGYVQAHRMKFDEASQTTDLVISKFKKFQQRPTEEDIRERHRIHLIEKKKNSYLP